MGVGCSICENFSLSEGFVGATVVAIGTSLPELATSFATLKKKKYDMLLGNIFGSNICNVLLVLGGSAIIKPFEISPYFLIDFLLNIATCLLFFFLCFGFKKYQFSRLKGFIFLMAYIGYVFFLFARR